MWKIVCAALMCVAVAGCAQQTSSRISSVVDPAYQGVVFTSLAVEAESGLQEREIIERTATARLNAAGIGTVASLDIMPPTRDYSQPTRKRKMVNSGMQGLLVITPADKRMIEDYIPGTRFGPGFSPYAGYGRYGGSNHFGIGGGMSFYDPPVVLREPQADYIASIYILPKFERVWTAEFSVRGASGMDFDAVAGRFAETIIRRLASDGLIIIPAR